jgi:hypothetical protein
MSYIKWLQTHVKKHHDIIQKLQKRGLSPEATIAYFNFENMLKKEPDFCPLYAKGQKCHDMKHLNCYLCACPFFQFNDAGIEYEGTIPRYSRCAINAKDTGIYATKTAVHQDCSSCTLPHHTGFIKKRFDFELSKIMQECLVKTDIDNK